MRLREMKVGQWYCDKKGCMAGKCIEIAGSYARMAMDIYYPSYYSESKGLRLATDEEVKAHKAALVKAYKANLDAL